jgi:hypothetical protein
MNHSSFFHHHRLHLLCTYTFHRRMRSNDPSHQTHEPMR